MIADHDHAVAGKELGALAVGRQEGALLALEALRAMDGHAFARHQLGQRVDLAFDALGPFGIDIDQAPALVGAAQPVAFRQQPALRLLVENNEILGRRDADHDLAQLAPFVMGAEAHELDTSVDVLVADDVVFLEVVAGLDLDDLERLACRDWPAGGCRPSGCRSIRSRAGS